MKKIEDATNNWKNISCSRLEEFMLLKLPCYKEIYRFSAISIKIPIAFFTEMEQKKILKFVGNHKDPK